MKAKEELSKREKELSEKDLQRVHGEAGTQKSTLTELCEGELAQVSAGLDLAYQGVEVPDINVMPGINRSARPHLTGEPIAKPLDLPIRQPEDLGVSVTTSALEMSNVDIAQEFTDTIKIKRDFQPRPET